MKQQKKKVEIPTYSTLQKIAVLKNNIDLGKRQEAIKSLKALKMDLSLGIFDKDEKTRKNFFAIIPDIVDFFRGDLEMECTISSISTELKDNETLCE